MNKLLDKLKKTSTIPDTSVINKSKIYGKKDMIKTDVPMINVALSGDIDGGLTPGVTILAGPSKHFKSAFSLIMAAAYQKKYPDGVVLFYDSEFGTPQGYFDTFGVDVERVIHTPVTDVEQLKHDIMVQLKNIERGDRICVVIDSIGNLASKKEVDDAVEGKSVADMSRAKAFKSFFRMITPHLTLKDIPLIAINHTYKEMCLDGSVKIKTSDGSKQIKDIKVGDKVYALNGIQEVLSVYGPDVLLPEGKRFLELTFDDGSKVKCTHDHLFYTKEEQWVSAENLKIGTEMF